MPKYRTLMLDVNTPWKYDEIIENCMHLVWKMKKTRKFQLDAVKSILSMKKKDVTTKPTLLVQGTGGGKSAVMQTLSTLLNGVTIVFENTLSLSSDQLSKVDRACQYYGLVQVFHLDSLKDDDEKKYWWNTC